MRIKLMVGSSALALALMGCGSSTNGTNTTNTTNMRTSAETTANTAEYVATTTTDNGVTTETRTYSNNPRISKVIITTRDGKRTAKVVSVSGEEKELRTDDLDDVLRKSGDEIATAAGFVADKTEDLKDVGEKVGDKAKDVGSEAADKGEDVIKGTANRAKKVGEKTAEGAKTVGEKVGEGAKKTGSAIKKAVTP